MTICGACQEKTNIEETRHDIWDFNPYSYDTYFDMKSSFRNLVRRNIRNLQQFYRSYNENGYTYTQWYVYVISKNSYKCKRLYKQTWWLLDIMSKFSFFKELIKIGKREDNKHNSLHHFLKYLDNYNKSYYQSRVIELFTNFGLELNDEDSEGFSGYDYINQKMLTPEDLELTKEYTKIYKESENIFKEIVHEKLDNYLEKCEICGDAFNIYSDMLKYKEFLRDIYENNKDLVDNIIKYRKECVDIYKKYPNMRIGTERHDHIVDIYKNIFDLQNIENIENLEKVNINDI
jgi:hypothetical protein